VEDDEHPGHLSTSKTEENVEKTSEIVWKDWRLSFQIIAEMANMDKEMVKTNLAWPIEHEKGLCQNGP
jgi:hypothetical protein